MGAVGSELKKGAACGLLAAALFGLSAPLAKLLLPVVSPLLLAGLLYLGAGVGLSFARFGACKQRTKEAALQRADVSLLFGIVVAGGVLGPLLMLLGLERLTGFNASLLLNLEGLFTILIAVFVFREHIGWKSGLATVVIVAGAAFLKLRPGELGADWLGIGALAAACLCWAVDNNLTQRVSLRDPVAIVRIKTLSAGAFNTGLALALGYRLPGMPMLLGALALGFASYGASVVLDTYALRFVGAAREAAFFATAPFVGALASMALLGERITLLDAVAMTSMAAGVVLLIRDRHSHWHMHEPLEHEHRHVHDEHHQHAHEPGTDVREPHSHWHRHESITHEHPHVSDVHHRHRHH